MRAVRAPNVITTADELSAVVKEYLSRPAFCYDLETVGKDRINPRLNQVSVLAMATDGRHDVVPMEFRNGELDWIEYPLTATGKARKARCELEGKEFIARRSETSVDLKKAVYHWKQPPEHLSREQAFEILRPLLLSDRLKVGHNLKFDLGSLYSYLGQYPEPPYADTMIGAYLVNSNWRSMAGFPTPYGLAAVTKRETDHIMVKGVGENIALHPWADVMHYAAIDAKFTWLCWRMLRRKIAKRGLQRVFEVEMEVLRVLLDMERVGAPIDQAALRALNEQLIGRNGLLTQAEMKVYTIAGRKFPIGSSNAKVELLYGPKSEGGQGLEPRRYTKMSTETNKRPSVDAEALEYYRHKNKLVEALLGYTDLAKLHNTYVRSYLEGIKQKGVDGLVPLIVDGRIHADFNQIGAQTGRFSCRTPNLQNVPNASTDMGKAIRGLFIAPPGHKLIVADFSQIELRVLAHFSKDQNLTRAFIDGQDIHQATADALGMTRRGGKAMNFTIVFSGGPDLVAARAGVSIDQAKRFMGRFKDHYAGIPRWRNSVIAQCRREQPPCVRTLLGRVRFLPDINNTEQGYRMAAERQAGNTVIQGSAADIIKLSMVRAHRALPEGCDLILTVHDELVITAPDSLADEAAKAVTDAMQDAYQLSVPLPADVRIVDRWSEAKD